ncbi:MAG: hypothetical protein AVDCRST_MAG83-1900 [uncultured Arthrobacter sp.]|uniref:Putative restriction endonuclease domain-containing protein n=1 Tax=uncultured Arthrobacter sp. TaxID=114050 RepID=A0A6J4IBZ1_9MICC|nr:Uma2 family endonuclease [uncultured Arthrobacter sp.]CAA9245961.1 MAG: hypothetical protein AVDCRST_MAG83-1900 [uncultured Arthrobacter sp.]
MTMIAPPELMTTEALLALPEDGVYRELFRGEVREKPMTRRSRPHSRTEAKVVHHLSKWLDGQPEPRGEIVSGEAAVRLHRNPDTTVGVDIAYISAAVSAASALDAFLIEGAPVLAVEILSRSDTQEDILEKVQAYLDAGVQLVWVIEPIFRTVTVYRQDAPPELFNINGELIGDPHMPGLRVAVADLFAR